MVDALASQTRLLWAHLVKAQTDADYWGEVATKLRLLIVEGGNNRALLLRVAKQYEARLTFDVRPDGGPSTWEDLLDSQMLRHGDKSITVRQVICGWSEQQGGAHQDWSVDEMLLRTQDSAWAGRVGGKRISLAHNNLTAIAMRVIETSNKLLDGIRRLERLKGK